MLIRFFSILFFLMAMACAGIAQTDSAQAQRRTDFQIYLKQPAKEIKLLMYEKNFLPIQGRLSDDKKTIIMQDYQRGNKVHVKVIYEDGMMEEFTKSPCFIDPVIT